GIRTCGGLPANVGCCLHQGLGAQHGFRTPLYYQVLNFGMIVSLALMIWKRLMLITGSQSPIVVVLSGSTGPAFHRRDLFLTNQVEDPTRLGETGDRIPRRVPSARSLLLPLPVSLPLSLSLSVTIINK
uniref:Uncharacterized protein n=1 Tax=Canis lupus familiaris TaxID=9615 RepID=A0A8C0NAJ2_CANLF